INVGCQEWNFQVADLAEAVRQVVPGTAVDINRDAPPDRRSYRVDFSRYRALAPDHQPQVGLQDAVLDLQRGLAEIGFSDADFRNSDYMRLNVLNRALESGRLQPDLRWSQRAGHRSGAIGSGSARSTRAA